MLSYFLHPHTCLGFPQLVVARNCTVYINDRVDDEIPRSVIGASDSLACTIFIGLSKNHAHSQTAPWKQY